MNSEVNILLVEDDLIIAEDISSFLFEKGYHVLEICYTKEQAVKALNTFSVDLALLDINLGKGNEGIELAHFINRNKNIPFIFLTSYSDKTTIDQAKTSHPLGYITKPIDFNSLFSTIEIALFNFSKTLSKHQLNLDHLNQALLATITQKEFDMLQAIYSGKNNQQIAKENYVSINTVKTHIRNLYDKLQVHSRSELLAKVRLMMD